MKEIEENSTQYPIELKKLREHPNKLFATGNIDLLNSKCIAIVGSRHCSEYGLKMARKFSFELANLRFNNS